MWHRKLSAQCPAPLRGWLREPGSLTARCEAVSQRFRVELLKAASGQPAGAVCRVPYTAREVLLRCDETPVIYAQTTLPLRPRGLLSVWIYRLGARSLGSLLFHHPGFRRGPILFQRLDRRHPLFQAACEAVGLTTATHLWARQSTHGLGRQSVCVTEVFLPGIIAFSRT